MMYLLAHLIRYGSFFCFGFGVVRGYHIGYLRFIFRFWCFKWVILCLVGLLVVELGVQALGLVQSGVHALGSIVIFPFVSSLDHV